MKLLTSQNKSAYNAPVITKKVMIGRGNPNDSQGAHNRLTSTRLSGFFVRSYHFLTSEACGQLRAGRVLESGISTPQRLAHHRGKWFEAPINFSRSLAMQEVSAFEPTYEIGFVLQHIKNHTLKPEMANMSAKHFRIIARSILKVLPDSLHHPVETYADKFEQSYVLDAANGLLEAADYLESIAKFSKEA